MHTFGNFLAASSPSLRSLFAPFLPSEPVSDPLTIFLVIMTIMLVAPLLFERIRLPGIVGLILAGVIVGPHGFGFLERDTTIVLLGTVGLLFLMFMAGLETSLDDLKFNAKKAIIFGLATFAVPMAMGIVAMRLLGYPMLASVLVASCFASHTLLALPIASKLGIMRSQSVTVTLGGTLITNVLALLVLAVVVKAQQGNLTLSFWLFLLPSLGLYTFATLWGVPRLGRWFFRRFGHDEGAEFTFVVATLFVVSYFAKLIEIEPIIGAFLAGIAITQLIPQLSPLMNRIQFIGNTLFVPFFLISVGMLVNPLILFQEPRSLLVSAVMVGVAIVAKFVPAWGASKLFKFDFSNMMVIFGLSVAQAASTLAAITVAFNIKLVDQLTVNGTIAMILVTCVASPWITARWGEGMKDSSPKAQQAQASALSQATPQYRILVPVANPSTEDNLLQLALILAKSTGGTLLPLHVLSDAHAPVTTEAKLQQERLLAAAETIAHAAVTDVEPIGRVDDAIDKGILRTAQERNATLLICGWKGYSTYRDNFFGSVIDNVARRTLVPMLITRFPQPIQSTQRIFLAIADAEATTVSFQQTLVLTRTLATELKASLKVLQLFSNPRSANAAYAIPGLSEDVPVQKIRGNFANQVAQLLERDDLLVIMHNARPKRLNEPTLGVEPEAIARQHPELSIIIAHFPRLV
ncbi:cation:proton antiporter [Leptolyngbya sp. FACHB-321]|uniref:cation:proton antiporter domain-containing protein n=1 Tax=Leptolyngbya sp. FACHB-321 TaxID=2692807 RepID=UPI0016863491|nr:cation:proton antiporter [Leptolyngbya sp. FACHB-321]